MEWKGKMKCTTEQIRYAQLRQGDHSKRAALRG